MEFELDVWRGGYPVWIIIRQGDNELKFSHTKLLELDQLVQRAKRDALRELPKQYWHEISAEFAVGGGSK